MIDSYKTLPLYKYDKIRDIIDSRDNERLKDSFILSILSDKDPNEILRLPVDEVSVLLKQASFLSSPIPQVDIKTFEYSGFTFSTDISLTYSQYMDTQSAKNYTSLLHAILVPEGHSYNDGYQVDFSNLDTVTAISIITSFMNGWMASIKDSLTSSRKAIRIRRMFSKSYNQMYNFLGSIVTYLSSVKFGK